MLSSCGLAEHGCMLIVLASLV